MEWNGMAKEQLAKSRPSFERDRFEWDLFLANGSRPYIELI